MEEGRKQVSLSQYLTNRNKVKTNKRAKECYFTVIMEQLDKKTLL